MSIHRAGLTALMEITSRPALVFVRGEGSWLEDHTGKRYLDFIQGWAVNCLGHNHPAMIEALARQSHLLINPSPAFYNQPSIDLARRIVESSCFDRVFFANSGSDVQYLCVPSELCIDADLDSYGIGPGCIDRDCDDDDATSYPGADEVCDGADNDCDLAPDNGLVVESFWTDADLDGDAFTGHQ